MAKGDWWLKLNMSDWLTDPALRRLKRENRDSWLTACLMMTKAGEYRIKGTMDEIGSLLGLNPAETKAFVDDLKRHNVADVTLSSRSSHVDVTLVSRRYKREAKLREQNTLRKRKQRGKEDVTQPSRDIVKSKEKEVRKEEKNGNAAALGPVAAVAAVETDPVERRIWTDGVELLTRSGQKETAARSYLGRLIKDHSRERVAEAIAVCQAKNPADPKAYIIGVLQERATAGVKERASVGKHDKCPLCSTAGCLGWMRADYCVKGAAVV